MNEFKRKEVWLPQPVVNRLQRLADKRKWSLKQYMESVLVKESNKGIEILPSFKSPTNTAKK